MNDLTHFVPLTDTVTIRGKTIKLAGIDIEDLGQIFFRFPEIAAMLETRTFNVAKVSVSKQAVAALLAAGCGKAGDAAVEKSLANLSLGERSVMFAKVFRLTSPDGIGPFTELVVAMRGGGQSEVAASAAKERKRGRVLLKPSSTPRTT